MKKIRKFILLNLILLMSVSCTSLKEVVTNQKKKSTDEFFVEKKSTLVMPPSYGELPTPTLEKGLKVNENNIEKLIGKSKDETSQTSNNQNKSLEKSILGRIKKN